MMWLYWSWLDNTAGITFSFESGPRKAAVYYRKTKQNKNPKSKKVKICVIWIMPHRSMKGEESNYLLELYAAHFIPLVSLVSVCATACMWVPSSGIVQAGPSQMNEV